MTGVMGIKEREEGANLVISRDIDKGELGRQAGMMGAQYQRSYLGTDYSGPKSIKERTHFRKCDRS